MAGKGKKGIAAANSLPVIAYAILASVLLIFLSAGAAAASVPIKDFNASFTIFQDKALVDIALAFKESVSEFEWVIPKDSTAVEVKGASFELVELEHEKSIKVSGQHIDALGIKYVTGAVIEQVRKDNFFLFDLSGVDSDSKLVNVRLPEKATLKYPLGSSSVSVLPKTADVSTDGKSIIIKFDGRDLAAGASIMVIYNTAGLSQVSGLRTPAFLFVFFILFTFAVLYYRRRKSRFTTIEKPAATEAATELKVELTRNLFDEEKKMIEILLECGKDGLWQKQLEIKTGFSKVKLSRKLRSLEQKGLIEKIPVGNANKIRLKKP